MRKIALVFVVAVFVPSLVLAWLAVRSLRDQQFVLERQQSLLYQAVADSLAKDAEAYLAERQREFGLQVEALLAEGKPEDIAGAFDDRLRKGWALAEVGFVVSLEGKVICPSLFGRPDARRFRLENDKFLCSKESVEVYWNSPKGSINLTQLDDRTNNRNTDNNYVNQKLFAQNSLPNAPPPNTKNGLVKENSTASGNGATFVEATNGGQNFYASKPQQKRSVIPQQQGQQGQNPQPQQKEALADEPQQMSKVAATEAEFRQLIGDANEGTVARFLQNKLKLLFWYRSPRDPQLVFGAQLDLPRLTQGLRELVKVERALTADICAVLLDDTAHPVVSSTPDFQTNWKRPFVATEIGEALPHWEMAVYLLDPAKLTQAAITLKTTISLLVGMLVLAIGFGGWLIVHDLRRQLTLARQKTDFVSNVSHELKTPLTSIRMFSELLAEGRVTDETKRRSYLQIISAETARLTRLINNVLDFSRMERGEKKYHFEPCDLTAVTRETVETYRPHLETNGFTLECAFPEAPLVLQGDRDALAQVLVNLLSNAEKYSTNGRKEITVRLRRQSEPLPFLEVEVLDRGLGVPRDSAEKIFEQFYRAHDSLSSGIQGSGLGLTLARQIARAHGGEVAYAPREGGGSCFTLRLPLQLKNEN